MTDDALLAAFDAGTLDPDRDGFDHRRHVHVAWMHVMRLPLLEAVRRQCVGLQRLTARLGVPEKFHATITVAWVLLIADRAARGPADWPGFAEANPDLLASGGRVLGRHYSPAALADPAARAGFVIPDAPSQPAS